MILLLVGLVCLGAALGVARSGADGASHDVRGAGAAAWMALLGLLVLAQLGAGRGALDGYRLTLLGFRLELPRETPSGEAPTVGGDYETADLWAPGAGTRVVARVRRDTAGTVRVAPAEDGGALILVEEPGLLRTGWRVPGGRPVAPGDTVTVAGAGAPLRLVASTVPDTLTVAGRAVPLPWVREHVVGEVGIEGGEEDPVLLPGVERGLLARLRPYHPSVFQRTYPLSDVLAGLAPSVGARLPGLSSFFFYRDGRLHLADLDSEVAVVGSEAGLSGDGEEPVPPGARLLVAGLPLRDYPEPDLVLPERYGVRPLRSFRLDSDGRWLDAALSSPETHTLERAALEELRLPGARDAEGEPVYRIRLASARQALARQAVVFDAAPQRFAVPGQAVLTLPVEPTRGTLEVLTPSGLAGWETGRPLSLGTGPRQLLVRVDGSGTSAGFWWVHLALLALPVALVLARPMTGPVFALALTAAGLAAFRLVLSLSAMAGPPDVMEAWQLGLWLFPYLPWAVVVAGEVGRPAGDAGGAWFRRGFHGGYALVLAGLAAVLFPGSGVKTAALSALALSTAGAWWTARRGLLDARAAWRWVETVARRRSPWLRGWSLGLGLLAVRAVLELLGFREQVTLAGTRIGVSVFYTPILVLGLAFVLVRAGAAMSRARGSDALPAVVARTLLDVGAFLLLALVGVSAWISDFGIALALLPGALALLALCGIRWAPRGRAGTLTVATLALPLVLLALVQAAPPLLRFAWGGGLQAVDARLGEWQRNELLLLERGDPAGLAMIGQRRSEALAVMRETMRSYTRGNVLGKGFHQGRVSEAVAETSTREHAVSALLASQFGLPGTVGLVLVLLSLLPPGVELLLAGRKPRPSGGPALRAVAWSGLGLAVLVPAAYLLPPPFNALLAGLAAAAAVAGLAAPAFGRGGLWKRGAGAPDPMSRDSGPESGSPGSGAAGSGGAGSRGAGSDAAGSGASALPFPRLLACSALLVTAGAGLYMVLANYGLVFFTGKNVYLLGLDSLGDALEATALLALGALALGSERGAGEAGALDGARRPERPLALEAAGAGEGAAEGWTGGAR